jgi:hypothetical protein
VVARQDVKRGIQPLQQLAGQLELGQAAIVGEIPGDEDRIDLVRQCAYPVDDRFQVRNRVDAVLISSDVEVADLREENRLGHSRNYRDSQRI